MSSSVIRRYTPPTCTLEIIGQSSPLSRWMKQPVIKNLRFRLHFDDPRKGTEAKITVKGDRTQLESLCDLVTTTVQTLLTQSPPTEPKRLTQHQLNLGPLGEDDNDLTVTLSALQLFDLATAIEQYTLDLVTLPEEVETPKPISPPNPTLRFVASFLLGLGITATSVIVLKDLYPYPEASFETATQPQSEKETQSPEIEDNASIVQQPTVPSAPLEEVPSPSPSPMTSDEKLPPPPPVGETTPESPDPPPIANVTPSEPPSIAASAPPPAPSFPPPEPVLSAPPEGIALPPPIPLDEPESAAILPAPEAELPALAPAPSLERPPTELDDVIPPTEAQSASPPLDLSARAERNLFDNIPQVAEARQYFEQRWTPPESLNKTIEYNITLNVDGTVQGISPLGETAATYLDRTGIPLLGEPLVSPLESNLQPRLRVVFNPDGTVQTFLQSSE
ncbi:MAG: DUF4335 domain-containing protein [Roseofilum sp. Belize BBD 4]|uniref:DUF4335 domain-containing protein n=1 Tax=Roseofilum sp. Belize BBD 4 TaxID=2821500 RepID=UPI001B2B6916|nr:DUF4335 domain-containing protein [Roseofilum sp. Belize BBD 4]MBP0033199.1 DUF4335 domain-containing protein [Roseofilum sp. Belize BBD 4]